MEYQLPPGPGRDKHTFCSPFSVSGDPLRADILEICEDEIEGIFHIDTDCRIRDDRRFLLSRLFPLLYLLGGDADTNVPADWRLGRTEPHLCSGKVFPLYACRKRTDAGRDRKSVVHGKNGDV